MLNKYDTSRERTDYGLVIDDGDGDTLVLSDAEYDKNK